jgi:hypothetical protein
MTNAKWLLFAAIVFITASSAFAQSEPTLAGTPTAAVTSPRVRVVTAKAKVMTRPASGADVVMTAMEGTVLDVIDGDGAWYWVSLPPDRGGMPRRGWIHARDVKLVAADLNAQVRELTEKVQQLQQQLNAEQSSPSTPTERSENSPGVAPILLTAPSQQPQKATRHEEQDRPNVAAATQKPTPAGVTRTSAALTSEPITPLAAAMVQRAVLRGIKQITVEETVVGNPENVKEDFAPTLVADSLRSALRSADFTVVDDGAPVRAHIVLDEFSSGSMAMRFVVGMGAGRSTLDARLVLQDADGKELANVKIRVRGNLAWSPYQGNNTQRKQASNAFDQRLTEEIARLK